MVQLVFSYTDTFGMARDNSLV